jgi:hypothetical protein
MQIGVTISKNRQALGRVRVSQNDERPALVLRLCGFIQGLEAVLWLAARAAASRRGTLIRSRTVNCKQAAKVGFAYSRRR